jgi:hypothetical protein
MADLLSMLVLHYSADNKLKENRLNSHLRFDNISLEDFVDCN